MNQKYNKQKLWWFITRRINHSVHRLHVISIINILIEELVKELRIGNEIKLPNFGIFKIKELKPKKIRNIATKDIKFVKRTKALRFRLSRKISKYLSNKSLEKMKNSVKICEENQEQ